MIKHQVVIPVVRFTYNCVVRSENHFPNAQCIIFASKLAGQRCLELPRDLLW